MSLHQRFHLQYQTLLSLYLCTSCLCYVFVIVVQCREEGLDGWWSGQVIGCTVITIMVTPPAKARGQETMHTSLYEKVCTPLPLHNFLAYCIVLVISFDKNIPPQLALMLHTLCSMGLYLWKIVTSFADNLHYLHTHCTHHLGRSGWSKPPGWASKLSVGHVEPVFPINIDKYYH